ncbi:murein hydrolase activator EnvC family protein [Legionella gresilensis]|uniref:murein hydrolase activator EnvC family protein n=1 Tax=Legionella gresilensis TaxID=91823 RepID=UPI0010411D66|nr:peptidoglycan DD-metalloendopeptidase family protein [Legionella gresilensis]
MANNFSIFSKKYHFLFILLILPFINCSFATNTQSITETQNKLKQLTNRINKLKQNLTNASDKKSILNRELAKTEKKIDANLQKLQLTEQELTAKQQKINGLSQQINETNQLLRYQQKLLAEHIRIRYKTGEYQPLKWIINQNDFLAISRLLTYHQYLASSRRQIIAKMTVTKTNLGHNQAKLKIELETKRALQKQLAAFQEKLKRNKEYQSFVIQNLNDDIQTKQQSLLEYEHNKENLAKLLTSLNEQATSFTQAARPFTYMRHKLQLPVHTDKNNYQKMNQGITFFAAEGTPVYAIYSGKIVFSDWLNGYGLLLIIDHGQGFMSLYAHNQTLYKKQGTIVQIGEQIAAVGHTGGVKQNGLYFEIRQHGKAVPPFGWLS